MYWMSVLSLMCINFSRAYFKLRFLSPLCTCTWLIWSRMNEEFSFLLNILRSFCCTGPGSTLRELYLHYSFSVMIRLLKGSWIFVPQVRWHLLHSVEQSGSSSSPTASRTFEQELAKSLLQGQIAIFAFSWGPDGWGPAFSKSPIHPLGESWQKEQG